MDLNLTPESKLSKELVILLNNIALEIRPQYNLMIEELGKGNEDNIDWWVSDLASRNTFADDLFLNLSYLCFVNKLLTGKNGKINNIIVPSKGLRKVLLKSKQVRKHKVNISISLTVKKRIKYFLKPIISFFYSLWHLTRLYFFSKIFSIKNNNDILQEITLIDTFLLDHSFTDSRLNDRYYDHFCDFVSKEEYENFYYTPTYINISSYKSLFKNIRTTKDNFILKEDYIKINDWLYAFMYPFRSFFFRPKKILFDGFNITPLLRKIWFDNLFNFNSFDPLLKYRFAKRLKQQGVKIRLVIDWFENQSIDKGFNAGFKKFYPGVKILGYQVAWDAKYPLCYYPTSIELNSKILPDIITVTGKAFVKPVKEYCINLNVEVAPAFRYQHIWKERNHFPDPDYFTVLLLLPITLNDAENIIEMAASNKESISNKKIRFWIKVHPSWTQEQIKNYYRYEWPDNFIFVEGQFQNLMEKSDIVVGNNSSALLETIARGIPVIIVASKCGLTMNPIPGTVDDNIWKLCYDEMELGIALKNFGEVNKLNLKNIGEKIKEEYFTKVDENSVRQFLKLN